MKWTTNETFGEMFRIEKKSNTSPSGILPSPCFTWLFVLGLLQAPQHPLSITWWCGCTPSPLPSREPRCHPTLHSHIFPGPLLSDISHTVPFSSSDKGVVTWCVLWPRYLDIFDFQAKWRLMGDNRYHSSILFFSSPREPRSKSKELYLNCSTIEIFLILKHFNTRMDYYQRVSHVSSEGIWK